MALYARSDVSAISVSPSHGGCGNSHHRPANDGNPDPIWKLECAACERHLRNDPLFSPSLAEVPETPDETKSREDFDKRGAFDRDAVMAMAMAKLAGVELPETMRRPLSGLKPHVPVVAGEVLCPDGHVNSAGVKFCGECGMALRTLSPRVCPDGHEVAARARFCGECGKPAAAPGPGTPALEAPRPAAGRRVALKDMRAADLKTLARERGVDDSGSRAQVLARLQAA